MARALATYQPARLGAECLLTLGRVRAPAPPALSIHLAVACGVNSVRACARSAALSGDPSVRVIDPEPSAEFDQL